MWKVLFVTSEAHPLVKTGGLADVSSSLPAALQGLGHEVRIVLPAYRGVLEAADRLHMVAVLDVPGVPHRVRVFEGQMPDSRVPVWLVDSPLHFDRAGLPYTGPDGVDWPDNAERFATFARAAVELAQDRAGLGWKPDVVHCNDWQSGLVPALLQHEPTRPPTVFTIHNLAYQGLFPWADFAALGLPSDLWAMEAMEFHHQFSFIKGGLVYADWLTTVSPTYAKEIQTPAFGEGLDGLLTSRADRLSGILNGVDYTTWDPANDVHLPHRYSADDLSGKAENRRALRARLGLPEPGKEMPIIGMVGRLAWQKGLDLVVDALPELMDRPLQLAILGSGDSRLENQLGRAAKAHPDRIGLYVGYDEGLAHLVEAGSDLFLMPSRYEPCGLNQIYSLRYGTPPIVRRTGGLADTVVDATDATLTDRTATGFQFTDATAKALIAAVDRALALHEGSTEWRQLVATGMAQDFSWSASAARYLELYVRAAAGTG